MPSIEQNESPDPGEPVETPGAGTRPDTIDAVLREIDRELARSILRCEPSDEWQERLGRLIGRHQASVPDIEELVFRVDRMLVEHGSQPWSIERRGLPAIRATGRDRT